MFVQTVMISSLIVFTDWLFFKHMAITFSWEYFHLEHIWIRIYDQSNSMILYLYVVVMIAQWVKYISKVSKVTQK